MTGFASILYNTCKTCHPKPPTKPNFWTCKKLIKFKLVWYLTKLDWSRHYFKRYSMNFIGAFSETILRFLKGWQVLSVPYMNILGAGGLGFIKKTATRLDPWEIERSGYSRKKFMYSFSFYFSFSFLFLFLCLFFFFLFFFFFVSIFLFYNNVIVFSYGI